MNLKNNITYLAIGSAYSTTGGFQQHPPFLMDLINDHPALLFNIILCDPNVENPPEVATFYDMDQLGTCAYRKNNIAVSIIKDKFAHEDFMNNENIQSRARASASVSMLCNTINDTILAKKIAPQETHLLFVHDFTGRNIGRISDIINDKYAKYDETTWHIYKRCIIIDINNRIEQSCFPNMTDIYFGPLTFVCSRHEGDDAVVLEIFNQELLSDDEKYTILSHKYADIRYKLFIMKAILYRLGLYARDIISLYRQFRMILVGTLNRQAYHADLIAECCLGRGNGAYNARDLTKNLLSELGRLTNFVNFSSPHQSVILFAEFIAECKKDTIDKPYELINLYEIGLARLLQFVNDLPNQDCLCIADYFQNYTVTENKVPLYMELALCETSE